MRRWIAGLHGGQLVIAMIVFALAAGAVEVTTIRVMDSAGSRVWNAEREFRRSEGLPEFGSGDSLSPIQRGRLDVIRAQDDGTQAVGGVIAVAIPIVTLAGLLAMLWVWLGARRRDVAAVEAIDA